MSLTLQDVVPAAQGWIESLARWPPVARATESVWLFAAVEAVHLLSLAVIGGAVLALDLRLLGLILPGVPAAQVERRTRPWLHVGVILGLATGFVMGAINATGLLTSGAFLIKMAALLAAILFSYGVVRRVARRGDVSGTATIVCSGVALVILGAALSAFVAGPNTRPGAILIVAAGVAVVSAVARRQRVVLASGVVAIAAAAWLFEPAFSAEAGTGVAAIAAIALLAAAIAAFDLKVGTPRGERIGKLVAFTSLIAWVTVAAAGRWIGFS